MQFALLLMLLVAAPDAGQASGTEGAAANPTAQKPVKEKRICKRIDATESRLGAKNICKTAAEWKLEQEGHQRLKSD